MVEYYCHNDNKMKNFSDTKLKRLLLLAKYRGGSKSLYHYYYYLVFEGLVTWTLGTAFITKDGEELLEELLERGQCGNCSGLLNRTTR